LSRWFEQHSGRAGLLRIRLHDLRHSYASAALAAGVPAKVVSERLRKAAATTFEHEAAACRAKAATMRDKYGL
jgi:integrase